MSTVASPIPIRVAHPHELFIGGSWVDPRRGARIELVSPHREEVFATVAEASEPDVDAAVAAARTAFDTGMWPRMSPVERDGYLQRMSALLEKRLPELARAWVEQVGALASAAPFVIGGGKFWFDYYAGLAQTFPFEERRAPCAVRRSTGEARRSSFASPSVSSQRLRRGTILSGSWQAKWRRRCWRDAPSS